MEIGNKKWFVLSRIFGFLGLLMVVFLMIDAWVLGDYGPDKIWYINACITAGMFAVSYGSEIKADVTYTVAFDEEDEYEEDDYDEEDSYESVAPEFLKRMRR